MQLVPGCAVSASSATARSAASSPRTFARAAWRGSARTTSSSGRRRSLRCGSTRHDMACVLAALACRARRRNGLRRERGHGEPDGGGGRSVGSRDPQGHVVPRFQFGVARRESEGGRADRWRRRAFRRGRGDDLGAAAPDSRPAAARRAARAGAAAAARRAGLCRQGRVGEARRRVGHQDVPQRHDQGPRSHGRRKLHHRARLRRRGFRAGVAQRDLPRHRLGSAREPTSSSA